MRFSKPFAILTLLALLVAACTTPVAIAPTAAPTASTVGYQPIAADACAALRKTIADTLKTEATAATAPFTDMLSGTSGEGCTITAGGNGVQFGSMMDTATALQHALEAQGWAADVAYAADGPTGTAFGLRQGTQLVLVAVNWQPAADANCPADQPISACELTPEQQLYAITVQAAANKQ